MAREGTFTSSFTYDGKRYYAYGKTKEEAKANAKVKKALLEAGQRKYSNITVQEWADEWLETYKAGTVSDGRYNEIERAIRRMIAPEIGVMKISAVKPIDIVRLYNSYAGVSSSLGRNLVQTTRNIFDAAEENDLIRKSPARHVDAPRFVPKGTHRAITEKERALTLAVAEKHQEGLFFLIMLYCGLRPQEVAALKMGDYDKRSATITVQRARKANDTIGETKSKAGVRVIPVPDKLGKKLNAIKKKPEEFILTNTRGKMYTRTSQRRLWARFKKYMDIENGAKVKDGAVVKTTLAADLTPYCYRHTFCTDLQDAGVPITEAKYLMGHSSIRLTADIYTHHSDNSDARNKMNAYHNR